MKVAIVGSGISACACGVRLKKASISRSSRRRISRGQTNHREGRRFLIEGGPDSFLPEKYWTLDLIREVGLSGELLPTNEEHKGPTSSPAVAFTGFLKG